jgi:hypothetical protein
MVSAPGFPHLHVIKIQYTLTDFWLRDKLYTDTAPVPSPTFVTGDKLAVPFKLVPGSRQHAIKFVPGLQKHVPYPPCTGTTLWLKYLDPARMLRRVTQPPHIAGPLCVRVGASGHKRNSYL